MEAFKPAGDFLEGIGAGGLEALIGIWNMLKVIGGFIVIAGTERPKWAVEATDEFLSAVDGILKDPLAVLRAMGKSIEDTLAERGSAYFVGHVAFDVATIYLGGEGIAAKLNKVDDIAKSAAKITADDLKKLNMWKKRPSDDIPLEYNQVFLFDNPKYYDQLIKRRVYPPDDGFMNGSVLKEFPKDTYFSRYGDTEGAFLAPENVPFEARSLPPEAIYGEYHVYRSIKPVEMNSGECAPWFDQPGGGEQCVKYMPDGITKYTIEDLINDKYIVEVKR